jgi:hypothetical protein
MYPSLLELLLDEKIVYQHVWPGCQDFIEQILHTGLLQTRSTYVLD